MNEGSLAELLDYDYCAELFRQMRWPNGAGCPYCESEAVEEFCQYQEYFYRYTCQTCGRTFNDKTGTIFEQSKLPLTAWFVGIYLMARGRSTQTISDELGVDYNTALRMTKLIRGCIYCQKVVAKLKGKVEVDEHYQSAGEKGKKKESTAAWAKIAGTRDLGKR